MNRAIPADLSAQPAGTDSQNGPDELLGIGAAASRCGVSERALRYYQQIGLITPCGCTPGGMRRYSRQDVDRVTRIKQLQTVLGFNLDGLGLGGRSGARSSPSCGHAARRRASLHAPRSPAAPSPRCPEPPSAWWWPW